MASAPVKKTSTKSTSEVRAVTPRVRSMLTPRHRRQSVAATCLAVSLCFTLDASVRGQAVSATKAAPQMTYPAPQATYPAPQATYAVPEAGVVVPPLAPSTPLARTGRRSLSIQLHRPISHHRRPVTRPMRSRTQPHKQTRAANTRHRRFTSPAPVTTRRASARSRKVTVHSRAETASPRAATVAARNRRLSGLRGRPKSALPNRQQPLCSRRIRSVIESKPWHKSSVNAVRAQLLGSPLAKCASVALSCSSIT